MVDGEVQVIISINGVDGQLLQTTLATYKAYYNRLGWHLEGRAIQILGLETKKPVSLKYQPSLWE